MRLVALLVLFGRLFCGKACLLGFMQDYLSCLSALRKRSQSPLSSWITR
ncbi:MAG: 4Fe-4S binding protein [Spirochaetaceae bacterium]|nr:4Fe-4S binding protein [Spirochaetaceae bacterium]